MRTIDNLPDSVTSALAMKVIKSSDLRVLQRQLRHAILFRRQVHMSYIKEDDTRVTRIIEPERLFESKAKDQLVLALDVLRESQFPGNGVRAFRLDRVVALTVDNKSLWRLDHG